MCGICGAVSAVGVAADGEAVRRATDRIVHRGPDHGAVRSEGRCALGYRRLRVLDLVTGDQPVANETGTVSAVLNGEIYNFAALRDDLAAAGHTVPGTGDTPTLPHLYEEHGPEFATRLDGMFAIALWDAPRERLVLARDRFGKKPLLWSLCPDGTLVFASELKALLAFPGVRRRPRPELVDAYLALGYVPGGSILEGVSALPPGHVLVAEGGTVRITRYWELSAHEQDLGEEEWIREVRLAVKDAVRSRMVADVPLGALLSGGIDSSVVVAAMAEESSRPVRTFSVGFTDARYDERRYARLVAERFGTEHEELVVNPDAAELLPRLARAYDEPFGDSSALPTYLVCEHARRFVTVALTGDGGDEVFGGYERYHAHALAGRLDRVPATIPRVAARMIRLLPSARTEPRSRAFRGARFLDTAGLGPTERYGQLMEVFSPVLRLELYTAEALAEIGNVRSAGAILGAPAPPGITGLQLLDARTYLPDDLLYKADIASMAHSLELRSPLLDHHVAELALGLPDALKQRGATGKVALRRAFADVLPAEILSRGKRGFGVPVGRWFREDLRTMAGDLLLDRRATERGVLRREAVERLLADHVAARADHGARLWSLVMLEYWHREYVDHQPVADRTVVAR